MINDKDPIDPACSASEQYLLKEVQKVRSALEKTRIIAVVSVIVTFAYLAITTANFKQYVEPVSAAEIAKSIIAQKVSDSGPLIVDQVKQQIPVLIAQVPDYAQQQLPVYRANFENQFEKDLTSNLAAGSKDMDSKIDDYFDANKAQIKSVLASGQDTAAVKALGDGVSQDFIASLKTTSVGGETIQSKLDSSLDSLNKVQKTMDRLANAKDLTPQEKKTRHAIAIMTKMIDAHAPKASS
jgi:hypothetical protein